MRKEGEKELWTQKHGHLSWAEQRPKLKGYTAEKEEAEEEEEEEEEEEGGGGGEGEEEEEEKEEEEAEEERRRNASLSRQNCYSYGDGGSSISKFGLCMAKLENRNTTEIYSFYIRFRPVIFRIYLLSQNLFSLDLQAVSSLTSQKGPLCVHTLHVADMGKTLDCLSHSLCCDEDKQ